MSSTHIAESWSNIVITITKQRLWKLTKLDLWKYPLNNEFVPLLCALLANERCNVIDLTLEHNPGINDEGPRILCEDALTTEHCNWMWIGRRSLTNKCLPELCRKLQDEHWNLTCLSLADNKITDKG